MSSPEDRRTEVMITRRACDADDPASIADALVAIWHDIATELTPIIGARGVAALFGRTVYLISREHRWIGETPQAQPSEIMDLQSLHHNARRQSRDVGLRGSVALFDQFQELLISMIGAALSERLLRKVLDSTSSGHSAQDTTP